MESLTRRVHDLGVAEILYTDVARDGMLTGPDLETLGRLADIGPSVLASGGVSSVADIERLAALRKQAITGVIVGKALYENRFTLAEAIIRLSSSLATCTEYSQLPIPCFAPASSPVWTFATAKS